MRSQLVRVLAGVASAATCKWCRRPIVFRTTERGHLLPFNGVTTPRDVVADDRGLKWDTLTWDDLHRCAKRPARLKPTSPQRRFF